MNKHGRVSTLDRSHGGGRAGPFLGPPTSLRWMRAALAARRRSNKCIRSPSLSCSVRAIPSHVLGVAAQVPALEAHVVLGADPGSSATSSRRSPAGCRRTRAGPPARHDPRPSRDEDSPVSSLGCMEFTLRPMGQDEGGPASNCEIYDGDSSSRSDRRGWLLRWTPTAAQEGSAARSESRNGTLHDGVGDGA